MIKKKKKSMISTPTLFYSSALKDEFQPYVSVSTACFVP